MLTYAALCSIMHFTIMATKERLTVNLGSVEYGELQELARQHGVSMAWLGRQAVTRLLQQYKQREFQFPLDLRQSADD